MSPLSPNTPLEVLTTIGARVRWLLERRNFARTKHEKGFGANRLDQEAQLRTGYTSQLVRDTFTFVPSNYLARIAEVLRTNIEWLVTGRGPWERLPDFDDAGATSPRWEAARFARLCGLHPRAVEYIETRRAHGGRELTAIEWFDMARLRDLAIRLAIEDETETPLADRSASTAPTPRVTAT